jgi:hypothetical protein
MSDTIILNGIVVELGSDLARAFISDATRAAENLLTDRELMDRYELSASDLQSIAASKQIGHAIRDERTHRLRTGIAVREAAQQEFIRSPKIMGEILVNEQNSPKHRIEASRELRATAIPENQDSPAQSARFVIQINLGADVEIYNKSIAVNANDSPPDAQPKLSGQPKLAIISNDGSDNG